MPARTLSGLDVTAPDDFTGARNAALIIFDRSHLVAIPAWQAVLRDALVRNEGAGFYILIPINTAPRWLRSISEWALRLEISDSALQEDTAILWHDRERWLAAAGWPPTDQPLLTIASPDGTVHAIAPGMPRPGITARLLDALSVD